MEAPDVTVIVGVDRNHLCSDRRDLRTGSVAPELSRLRSHFVPDSQSLLRHNNSQWLADRNPTSCGGITASGSSWQAVEQPQAKTSQQASRERTAAITSTPTSNMSSRSPSSRVVSSAHAFPLPQLSKTIALLISRIPQQALMFRSCILQPAAIVPWSGSRHADDPIQCRSASPAAESPIRRRSVSSAANLRRVSL